ncbi:hypothetical protein HY638_04390 [Candidatus Woesearchaeota archaeon]|nr:hypothetical protein [Candidatus Woesearchaeota archaeon]
MEKAKRITLMFLDVVLLAVFIGLISKAFELKRAVFYAEFIVVLFLIAVAFVSLIAAFNAMRWGFILLSISFALTFLNMAVIYLFRGIDASVSVAAIASALGFLLSAISIGKREDYLTEAEEEGIEEIEVPPKKRPAKKN